MDELFLLLCCCIFCESYDELNNNNNNLNRENLTILESTAPVVNTVVSIVDAVPVVYTLTNKNRFIKRE